MRTLLLLLGLTSLLRAASGAVPRPNILLILTDDQGWPTLSSLGNPLVATPHLDRLGREGMTFTDAYAMPQCTPTRAALLTGQHTARNGMWHVIKWYGYPWAPVREPACVESLPRSTFTVAKGLQAAGYATACVGKWHLTDERDGTYTALKPAAAPAFGFDEAPVPPDPSYPGKGDKGVDWLTDRAIDFIERRREQPWFCYLAHHTIHGPVVAPPALVQKYRARGAPAAGLHNAAYLAAIEHLDNAVGRLLARLDALQLTERTLVVFCSDNGGIFQAMQKDAVSAGPGRAPRLVVEREEFSNAPLRAGKGSAYEGGIRVPLLVRWPGVTPAGRRCATPVHVVDFMPTFLAAAGAHVPAGHVVDGADLRPLLAGGALAERPLLWYMPLYELRWGGTPCAVIRRGDWKLIEYFGDRFDATGTYVTGHHLELFNLRADLGETRNLAGAEPAKATALRRELHALIQSAGAVIPGPNPHHDPARALEEARTKPAFLSGR